MRIQEVHSIKEALSIKAKMGHDGDYSVQAWEQGRELIIELPDNTLHIRWKEKNSMKTKPSLCRTGNIPQKEILTEKSADSVDGGFPISRLQGSSVFVREREGESVRDVRSNKILL